MNIDLTTVRRVCGARRADGSGRICQSIAVMPNGRCRVHGGMSLAGVDSPLFVHGRRSKYIPTRLAAKYADALQDTDILALRDELALIDARLSDLLEQVSNSESGELWKRCKEALRAYDSASDPEAKAEALGNLRWNITEGFQEYMSWNEIRETIEARRKLADTERQRLKDLQATIDARSAMMLVINIGRIIKEQVPDKDVQRRIARQIAKLTGSDKLRDDG